MFSYLKYLVFCFIGYSSIAVAQAWTLVDSNRSGSSWFIDASTIRDREHLVEGQVRSAWFLIEASEDKTVKYRTSKVMYEFRCAADELRLRQYIEYAADGRVLDSGQSREYSDYSSAAPGTIGASLLQSACSTK